MLHIFDGVKIELKLYIYINMYMYRHILYLYMDIYTFMYASFQVTWISFMSVRFHLVRY